MLEVSPAHDGACPCSLGKGPGLGTQPCSAVWSKLCSSSATRPCWSRAHQRSWWAGNHGVIQIVTCRNPP